jgi:hypothetical protein
MSEFTDTQRLDFLLQWGSSARFGVAGGPVDVTLLDLGGKRYRAGTERGAIDQAMLDHPQLVKAPAARDRAMRDEIYREAWNEFVKVKIWTDAGFAAVAQRAAPLAAAPVQLDVQDAARLRALVAHKISLERTEGPTMKGHSVNWAGHRQPPVGKEGLGQIRHSGVNTVARGDFVPGDDRPPMTEIEALREAIDAVVRNAEREASAREPKPGQADTD